MGRGGRGGRGRRRDARHGSSVVVGRVSVVGRRRSSAVVRSSAVARRSPVAGRSPVVVHHTLVVGRYSPRSSIAWARRPPPITIHHRNHNCYRHYHHHKLWTCGIHGECIGRSYSWTEEACLHEQARVSDKLYACEFAAFCANDQPARGLTGSVSPPTELIAATQRALRMTAGRGPDLMGRSCTSAACAVCCNIRW